MKRMSKLIGVMLALLFVFYAIPMSVFESGKQSSITASAAELSTEKATTAETAVVEVTAIDEITSLRTANSKTIRMSDGSYKLVQYGSAVHYEQNGVWHEYDNRLTAEDKVTTADFNGYRINSSNIGVKLGANSSDKALSLSDSKYALSFSVIGGNNVTASVITKEQRAWLSKLEEILALENHSQRIVYPNIFAGVNFMYTINGSSIKEDIVVAKKTDSYSYSFSIETTALTATLKDGAVSFADSISGKEIYTIPAGYMYDAEYNVSNAVSYELTTVADGKYTLTVTADKEWINAADRKMPVVIDPTVYHTNATQYSNIKDTQIHANQTSSSGSEGSYAWMRAGFYSGEEYRSLIGIRELPGANTIGGSCIITEATLSLHYRQTKGSPTITAHAITGTDTLWEAGETTWADNIPFDSKVIDFKSERVSGVYTLDITSVAQEWYKGTKNCANGILLKSSANTSGTNYVVWSTVNDTDYNESLPVIVVSYRDSKGIESRFSYSSQSAGAAGSGHVNLLTGNLVFVRDDIAANGNILPITVSHVYNTHSKSGQFDTNMIVGKGWKLSVQEKITETTLSGNKWYIYSDSDGTDLYFYNFKGGTTYYSEDGYSLKIVKSSSGYTMTDDAGNTKHFGSNGKVEYVTDTFGNRRDFVYSSNKLSTIKYTPKNGSAVTQLTFTYNSANALIKISNNQDNTEYVEFEYSDTYNGAYDNTKSVYLRSITYSKGKESLYTYNSNGTLSKITDSESGAYLQYTYDTSACLYTQLNNPVTQVTEYNRSNVAGQALQFAYGVKQTTTISGGKDDDIATAADNIKTVYVFDNQGRAVSSYSTDNNSTKIYGAANAEYTKAGAGDKSQHKITKDSVAGAYAKNLIANASVEASTDWNGIKSGDAYASSYSTDKAFVGTHSIKLTSTSSSGFAGRTQSFTVSTEDTYTFSAYIKAENFTSGTGGVYVDFYNSSYVTKSRVIRANTSTDVQNGWQRLSVTATLPAGTYQARIVLVNKVGTAYADCMQLEKDTAASSYNLMGNLRSGTTTATGNYTSTAGFTETLPVNKSADTTFVLSGWAKANSVAITDDDRKFGLAAVISYTDGTTETVETAFTPDNPNWQYTSTAVVAKEENKNKTISTIAVKTQYNNNANTAYFKDISLTMQPAQTYAYDSEGNLISLTDAENNKSSIEYADNDTDIASYTNIVGEVYEYTYNADYDHVLSAVVRKRGSDTLTTQYTYDAFGNVIKTLSTSGTLTQETSATYDSYGKQLTVTDENGNTTAYEYGTKTELLKYIDNANGNRTSYSYDARDRLTSTYLDLDKDWEKDTDESAVNYLYDSYGQLSTISTATTDYSLAYNAYGQQTSVKAGDYTLATYAYNGKAGKPTTTTYGNGFTTTNVYDALDRVVEIKYNNVTRYQIAYNGEGAVAAITDVQLARVTDYEYDSMGRLIRAEEYDLSTGDSILKTENKFDSLGRPTSTTYVTPYEQVTYSISYKAKSNLIASMSVASDVNTYASVDVEFTYDNLDRLISKGIHTNYHSKYETFEYITVGTKTGSLISKHTVDGKAYTYTYDAVGNIKTISLNGQLQVSYTYDKLNQLVLVQYADEDIGHYEYFYDDAGNMTWKGHHYGPGITTSDVYTYSYEDETWGDLLTSIGDTDITYDNMGNPLNWHNATSLTWQGRTLASATVDSGTYTFTYDKNGVRRQKIRGESVTEYITDGTKIIGEHNNGYNYRSYFYDSEGAVLGMYHAGSMYTYRKNLQGDITGIYNQNGTLVVEYVYDAYGNVVSITGSAASTIGSINPFLYRGYYYDHDLELYYLNSRYYDPQVGRFINADSYISTGQGIIGNNMFAYCLNNPVMRVDFCGQFSLPKFFKKIGDGIGELWDTVVDGVSYGANWVGNKIYGAWNAAEDSIWKVGADVLDEMDYHLTATLLRQSASGGGKYFADSNSYAAELLVSNSGFTNHVFNNYKGSDLSYECPVGEGDLGASLHWFEYTAIALPYIGESPSLFYVIVTDTFDFTETKNPFKQGSLKAGFLWFANNIAAIDQSWGLLDPVEVEIHCIIRR